MMSDTGKKKKRVPFWVLLIIDVLIAGLLLLVFAYFHHAKNYLQMKRELAREQAEINSAETKEGSSEKGLSGSFMASGTAYSLSFSNTEDLLYSFKAESVV
ncbi:MAG: hypothetical protein Q4F31_07325 [Eubacteriales bacterium]|nr:hypothetical protein [Eubacteriales bacterium]